MGRIGGSHQAAGVAGGENVAGRDQVDGIGRTVAVVALVVDLAVAVLASVAFVVDGVLGEWFVAVVVEEQLGGDLMVVGADLKMASVVVAGMALVFDESLMVGLTWVAVHVADTDSVFGHKAVDCVAVNHGVVDHEIGDRVLLLGSGKVLVAVDVVVVRVEVAAVID